MSDRPKVAKLTPKDAAKDPDFVLEQAAGVYGAVMTVGWDKEGAFDMRASLNMDARDILWLLESAKKYLMEAVEQASDAETP
jgi:hypothetical protein